MKIAIIITGLALFGLTTSVIGPREFEAVAEEPRICPDITKVRGICSVVYERLRAPESSGYRFEYERYMREAACADKAPLDSEENMTRLRKLWSDNPSAFTCDSTDFDVANGSLLKYSVSSRSMNFLNSAYKWKLDVNRVDKTDGRTLMDYLYKEVLRNRGTNMEPQLQQLVDAFRKAGGKFQCEIPNSVRRTYDYQDPVIDGKAVCP